MADAPGRGAKPGGARGGRTDAAAAGLPVFCRPRHFVRGANVFVVPLWDFTSRWLPEELKPYATSSQSSSAAAAAAAAPAAAASGQAAASGADATTGGGGEGDDSPAEAPRADAGDDDDEGASESEQSEVAWEGPLGGESRVWSRAEVEGALMLLRRAHGTTRESSSSSSGAAAAASGAASGAGGVTYGLAVSSALFAPGAQAEGSDVVLDKRLAQILRTREPSWAVVALRSGHFAGAVFRGPEPVVHKAVHRYTVRAKAGGSQSAKDNTGKTIKSAGSNLRRYGEQRLAEEIREFMTEKWATELAGCELIFLSVSKRMRSTLVGTEKDPYVPFSKVRKLPFMVGRPTFEAVKEAYFKVASVVFADEQVAEALAAKFKPVEVPTPAPAPEPAPAASEAKAAKQPEPAPVPKYREEDDDLFTALHAAAAAGDEDKIMDLLDEGADPGARDGKGRVAYYLCSNVKSREAFRRWRGANEDAWDWDVAQVPEGLTEELEQRKKDKEKEKKKKQKEKQKAAKVVAKFEEEERQRKEKEEAAAMEAAQTKCDYCHKGITGKSFSRLQYFYCTTDCVKAHQRALQAEAAEKRLG